MDAPEPIDPSRGRARSLDRLGEERLGHTDGPSIPIFVVGWVDLVCDEECAADALDPSDRRTVTEDRYAGKPFLRLVDAYVLWVIGALDPTFDASMQELLPKLNATFGIEAASWQDVVRTQMAFTATDDAQFRQAWQHQLEHDDRIGQQRDPVAWTHAMADVITTT